MTTNRRRQIKPYPLGAHIEADGCIRFSFVSQKENCGILLYDRNTGKRLKKLHFTDGERIGNIYCKYLTEVDPDKITYQFFVEDSIVPDSRARVFVGRHSYGKERNLKDLRAGFIRDDFDWEIDKRPHVPYEDSVFYCMHVRGFTRHVSSGVEHRGTFLGVVEKLKYLKDSGITAVELQPAYEFSELPDNEERRIAFSANNRISDEDLDKYYPKKLNYWGYKRGFYYAPKASYAYGTDASHEFKQMVKAFHSEGMEVIMQFYFPDGVLYQEIFDILHFWVVNYHVDGFHLMGNGIPVTDLAKDNALVDTKLLYYGFDIENIYGREEVGYRNLGEYNDSYLYDMRRFLKGDEGMLDRVLTHISANPQKNGVINYFTNYYGLTMMDMVSYDRKHNERNGEDNRDGNDYNYSWNCGEEGKSRRKKVLALRFHQIKNAYAMLLFSQGTPLIFMGDEFGNSQNGNNNPYCQDNATTWLDWGKLKQNAELYNYWRKLIKLRLGHPILHAPGALPMTDSLSCNYPALSYHGQNAWRAQTESYNRHIGVMFCGKYARMKNGEEDAFFYLAMNMYWEERTLALPKLPKKMAWKCIVDTSGELEDRMPSEGKSAAGLGRVGNEVLPGVDAPLWNEDIETEKERKDKGKPEIEWIEKEKPAEVDPEEKSFEGKENYGETERVIPKRSVLLFIGVSIEENENKSRRKGKRH